MNAPSSQPKQTLSLRWRVTLGFVALAILVSGLILSFVYLNFRNQLRDSLRQRLVSIVSIAALQQDGDAFVTIQSPDDAEYKRVWAQNTAILNADKDLVFVYTMRFDDEGLYFVVDAANTLPNHHPNKAMTGRVAANIPKLMRSNRLSLAIILLAVISAAIIPVT